MPGIAYDENWLKHDTWGHLFPTMLIGSKLGRIRLAKGAYGDETIIDIEIDIPDSPWWYDAITDFVDDHMWNIAAGDVVDFDITVRVMSKIGYIPEAEDLSWDYKVTYLHYFDITTRAANVVLNAFKEE